MVLKIRVTSSKNYFNSSLFRRNETLFCSNYHMTKSCANRQRKCMYKNHLTILQTQFQLVRMQKFPQEFFLLQCLIIEDEVFVGRFDKQHLNNLCLLNGDVLLPSSIVSDDKSSHTSPRRISSLIPLLIFSQRLLHFVVFGISTVKKKSTKGVIFYNQWKSFLFQTKKRGLRCVIIRSVVRLRKEQLCELERRVSVITALYFVDPVCPARDRLSSRTL